MLERASVESHDHPVIHLGPNPPAPWAVGEATLVYRPCHPERTSFYRIFEGHFEE